MLRGRTLAGIGAATVMAAACSDLPGPTSPAETPDQQLGAAPTVADMDRAIPGFGGFFFAEDGRPTIYLMPGADVQRTTELLGPMLTAGGVGAGGLEVRQAQFAWRELDRWHDGITATVLGLDGVVWTDADESTNRVSVGVLDLAAMATVTAEARRLGITAGALEVVATEPMEPMLGLRDVVRPVIGGVQIHFTGFLCTLGFNARDGNEDSFITNSHCTENQGGVDNTAYWQPLQSTSPTQIAVEVEDPLFVGGGNCPANRVCRNSDASRARYLNNTTFSLGKIARTGSNKNGSLTIVGDWTITSEATSATFAIGSTLNKVGRTTGWSAGKVNQTCVNVGISGTNIVLFCQTLVKAKVNSGDSGSPVFAITSGTNVRLAGILWGGGAGSFVFSPMPNIETDLGALTTH